MNASLPFDILAFGAFSAPQVRVRFDPALRRTTQELEQFIAQEWDRQLDLARGTHRVLFNGEMLRYVRHAVDEEPSPGLSTFEMTVGPTCYRDFVGTNLYGQRFLETAGWECFSNPVGTTATLVSADRFICYGRRSARVAYHAHHVHSFGGALEMRDRAADGAVDAFASLRRELHEELALSVDDLDDLHCVGLIRDTEIHQPELLFEARLKLTATELRDRWKSAEARDEHAEIVTLSDDPDSIVPFIKSCGPIAPVAIGALFILGRMAWGDVWYLKTAAELYNM
jgi:8-oxo-dGTP pyrophosphatase MutT (NUDIX family)